MDAGVSIFTLTLLAAPGPALVTIVVYDRFAPGATGSGESFNVTERSVCTAPSEKVIRLETSVAPFPGTLTDQLSPAALSWG